MSRDISMLPQYSTILFTDVWEDSQSFLDDYSDNGIPALIKTSSAETLYYLLYAKYGNNPIANRDVNQFKAKIMSIIFSYGPTWEKRLDIQAKLRGLTDAEVLTGAKAIYNQALNPSAEPGTGTLEELDYINQQNTTNYKKAPMEAYGQLWELLSVDVTTEFINKFKVCFKTFVMPERPLVYETEEEDQGE